MLAPLIMLALAAGGCVGSGSETSSSFAQTSSTSTSTTSISSTTLPTTSTTTTAPTTTTTLAAPQGVIAYNRDGELWLISADGTGDHALITTVVVAGGPSWSPDGTAIAFSGFEPGPQVVTPDIWIATSDGGDLTRLTNSPGPSMLSPSWSPDGSQIVFASTDRDLWIIDAGGGVPERLTSDEAHQSAPAWAPDGSLIAYCALPVVGGLLGDNDVWVMEPDGGDPRRLTDRGDACLPAWSPDSSLIAFTAWVFPEGGSGDHSDVWVMGRNGSAPRNLTNDPTRFDRAPTWSPDGITLGFDSAGPIAPRQDPEIGLVLDHDPPAAVFLIAVAGGPTVRLTGGEGASGAPAWQPGSV